MKNKIRTLQELFDTKEIVLNSDSLTIGDKKYPIINDVIILSKPSKYSDFVRKKLNISSCKTDSTESKDFARDIQYAFGEEWRESDKILEEHREEFAQYFDIVDIDTLRGLRICDLGCGGGRYSYFLKDNCKEIILVDFSDAIFIARKNLSGADNCLFFMCDLKELPFKDDFADFLFCLGVLHHLPTPCIDEVRNLKRFAPRLLIYLYHSLDGRPAYFRVLLKIIIFMRLPLCKIRNPIFRKIFSYAGAFLIYMPLIILGWLLKPLKLSKYIPLYEVYHNKSIQRIKQDVYDTFFVRIEQRVSRKDILKLRDTFLKITISNNIPYWHFLCQR